MRNALEADGWTITHDPFKVSVDGIGFEVDLGAEKLLGAEKSGRKIAVEVKSFLHASLVTDFHQAIGQCLSYQSAFKLNHIERVLYLAVPFRVYAQMRNSRFYFAALEEASIRLIVFDLTTETIVEWKE